MLDINSVTNEKYLLGAVNFYEDPHFSYFYLTESLDINTGEIYPGYTEIIALYANGIEKYFIRKEDAKASATWLLNKILSDPGWLTDILGQIEERSQKLNLFSVDAKYDYTVDDLLKLYELHFQLNIDLYKVARIPEALDRGGEIFTNYLKSYLVDKGFRPGEIPLLFDFLTVNDKPSIYSIEQQELDLIRQDIFRQYPDIRLHYSPLMLIGPELRKRISEHTSKWAALNYHGYRNPKLLSETDFFQRILFQHGADYHQLNHSASVDADISVIDPKYQALFGLYSEIGRVKIFRRFYQLSNFYNLDILLCRIAEKLSLPEIQVRFFLPEEIKSLLSAKSIKDSPPDRSAGKCIVYYKGNTQTMLSVNEYDQVERQMQLPITTNSNREFKGHCVSLGKVQGHAKKVDNIFFDPEKFNYGDILICQAIDPDYLPFLKKAAGVVTEQGGVTSHGSIICRELKIPAISGVVNLLDLIMENELVEVDAYNEVLKVVDKNGLLDNEILIKKELMTDPAIVGNKAANIFLASDKKIKVPDFHILCYETIRELYYNDPVKLKDLVQKVCYDLGIYPKSQFILRSSCVFEDSPKHFYAGYYKSVIMKNGEEIEAVEKIINHNKDKGYRGSIILQKFLEADYTGVCMLGDVNYKNTRHLVVEYSKGFINHATSGGLGINRFVYNVFTDEFVAEEIADEDRNNIQLDIIKWFNKIEAKFPNPTYLEWGCKDGEFYLYQLRIKLK